MNQLLETGTSYECLHEQMLKELHSCRVVEDCFWIANGYWGKLKELVKAKGFKNEKDEIYFFRVVKPMFTSWMEYYVILSEALIATPSKNGAHWFWEQESKRFARYCDKNEFFLQYFLGGETDKDDFYFLRVLPGDHFRDMRPLYDMDPDFCSGMDHVIRGYMAQKRYHEYVMKRLESLG